MQALPAARGARRTFVLEIETILFYINLTDPAQTYKLVIAHVGDVIGNTFDDAANPRGLSCAATGPVPVGNVREARLVPRVVIVTVADVLKNNGGRPTVPRAAPTWLGVFNASSWRRGAPEVGHYI